MASACSQRQTVAPLIEATMPRWTATSAICARPNRLKSLGSWHASALISTTISGGKNRRAPASWSFFETSQTFFEETFSPLGDNLARQIKPPPDLFVLKPLGSQEDDLRPNNITIR